MTNTKKGRISRSTNDVNCEISANNFLNDYTNNEANEIEKFINNNSETNKLEKKANYRLNCGNKREKI